jgi:hypothetical protein
VTKIPSQNPGENDKNQRADNEQDFAGFHESGKKLAPPGFLGGNLDAGPEEPGGVKLLLSIQGCSSDKLRVYRLSLRHLDKIATIIAIM